MELHNLKAGYKNKLGSIKRLIIYSAPTFPSINKHIKFDAETISITNSWVESVEFNNGIQLGQFEDGATSLFISQELPYIHQIGIILNTEGFNEPIIQQILNLGKELCCLVQLPHHNSDEYLVIGDIRNPFLITQNDSDTTSSFGSIPGTALQISGRTDIFPPIAQIPSDKFI